MSRKEIIRKRTEILNEMGSLYDILYSESWERLCSEEERELIKKQWRLLGDYQEILRLRIELLEKEGA